MSTDKEVLQKHWEIVEEAVLTYLAHSNHSLIVRTSIECSIDFIKSELGL